MTVKKCDRCLKEVDGTSRFIHTYLTKTIQEDEYGNYFTMDRTQKETYDLCEECASRIRDWILAGPGCSVFRKSKAQRINEKFEAEGDASND